MKTVAKVLIYNTDDNVLVLQRGISHPNFSGHPDFPGGGVEPAEAPHEAAAREVAEETGLHIDTALLIPAFDTSYDSVNHLLFSYTFAGPTPEVHLSWEHAAFSWMSLDTLLRQPIPNNADAYYIDVIQYLNRQIKPKTDDVILEGSWDDNTSWQFYLSAEAPDLAPCSAVYCLAVLRDGAQIVLTHIERGWEMLGGHIEPHETVEEAMVRECLEEGGFQPEKSVMFGYSKIVSKQPVANDHHGGYYPQISYIPYYLAVSSLPLTEPTGQEVIGRDVFQLEQIAGLGTDHEQIIRLGMECYASFDK